MKAVAGSRFGVGVQFILMFLWGAQLINTDAYYVNYVLLITLVGICSYRNYKKREFIFCLNYERYYEIVLYVFVLLFSFMVLLANYKIWAVSENCKFMIIIFFWGGVISFWNIFNTVLSSKESLFWRSKSDYRPNFRLVFFVSFGLLVLSRWLVLYYCKYPGNLTNDSLVQMNQITSGVYSNHHPFYHTMVIKCFVYIGLWLFNDINAAVATYSFFQIIFTSICFSLSVSTMTKMKAPSWMTITSVLFYLLMPYHILYSITMWKDIMFGCFVLLLITFFYRCMNDIGNKLFAYFILAISCLGMCLFRSNGFFSFVILTLSFIILFKKKKKIMIVIFTTVIILSFILKHSVLDILDVAQPDTIESLAIPTQQIARVVYDGCELNDWERDAINEVIDVEQIKTSYSPFIVDPIKNMIRQKGNQQLLVDERMKYLKLYLALGIKYPKEYIVSWIDETRGYWNAGYEYWSCAYGVDENNLGIEMTIRNETIDRMLKEYIGLFVNVQGFRLFLSIGLFVWIDIVMLMLALLRKDRVGIFVSLPILTIVLSLLVATPISYEFRYIYAAFCTLPIVTVIVLRPIKESIVSSVCPYNKM